MSKAPRTRSNVDIEARIPSPDASSSPLRRKTQLLVLVCPTEVELGNEEPGLRVEHLEIARTHLVADSGELDGGAERLDKELPLHPELAVLFGYHRGIRHLAGSLLVGGDSIVRARLGRSHPGLQAPGI
jgi:hypothetical protein